jgi:hypothetical protein
MSLKKVEILDYSASYSYSPPVKDSVVNTEQIVSAVPCESRYCGKTMQVNFVDGSHLTVVGSPEDLL